MRRRSRLYNSIPLLCALHLYDLLLHLPKQSPYTGALILAIAFWLLLQLKQRQMRAAVLLLQVAVHIADLLRYLIQYIISMDVLLLKVAVQFEDSSRARSSPHLHHALNKLMRCQLEAVIDIDRVEE